jgi:hypothetical protein
MSTGPTTSGAEQVTCRFLWLLVPLVLTVGCIRTLPPVQGTVLDARTGHPLEGVIVERQLFEKGPLDLAESHTGEMVPGGNLKVTTDENGRFVLPEAHVRSLSGMAWFVYKPGWMPGFGCYQEPGWSDGSCGGFPEIVPDPYVRSSLTRHSDRVEMKVELFPPSLEGVTLLMFDPSVGKFVPRPPNANDDPWGSYFSRLNQATQFRYLAPEIFADEATEYARDHHLTLAIYTQIYQVQQSLGGLQENGRYKRPDIALHLLDLQQEFCKQDPAERGCSQVFFEQRSAFLRHALERNQGTVR